MNCPGIVSLIDRRLWHPLTWNYVPADPGVWLFAVIFLRSFAICENDEFVSQRLLFCLSCHSCPLESVADSEVRKISEEPGKIFLAKKIILSDALIVGKRDN